MKKIVVLIFVLSACSSKPKDGQATPPPGPLAPASQLDSSAGSPLGGTLSTSANLEAQIAEIDRELNTTRREHLKRHNLLDKESLAETIRLKKKIGELETKKAHLELKLMSLPDNN